MTKFEDIAPTKGENANSFEWIWDIAAPPVSPSTELAWLNLPDITGLNPQGTPKETDDGTYANKGQDSVTIVGETYQVQVNVKGVKDVAGEFQPALLLLLSASDAHLPDATGPRVIHCRVYHATSAVLAYEFTAIVTWQRQNTGNAEIEMFSFTLKAKGDRKKITNPALTP